MQVKGRADASAHRARSDPFRGFARHEGDESLYTKDMDARPVSELVLRMASLEVLQEAWMRVADGSPAPGVDGVRPIGFARRLGPNLERLAADLVAGRYRAMALRPAEIRKPGGGVRHLAIPTVRDRVAQQAALIVLRPRLDPLIPRPAFAYRRGRSWVSALRRVEQLRRQGYVWAFRSDIASFFDEVAHDVLEATLRRTLDGDAIVELLMQWVRAPIKGRARVPGLGIPQGAPISPLLANLYLAAFDETVQRSGVGELVRYADDLVILCRSREDALAAWAVAEGGLRALRLRLNPEKTYVSSFERGFAFLGWVFFRDRGFPESPATSPLSPWFPGSGFAPRHGLAAAGS
jgi:group II intron reverse transcriptase/maturase